MNFRKLLFKKRIDVDELIVNILLKCCKSHKGLIFGSLLFFLYEVWITKGYLLETRKKSCFYFTWKSSYICR